MTWLRGVLLVVFLLVAACGTATGGPTDDPVGDLRLIVLPDSSGRMPADVEIGCPSGPTFPASALGEIPSLAGTDLDSGIETAIREFLDNEEGQFWPQDDWRIMYQADNTVLLVHVEEGGASVGSAEETSFAFMTVELTNGDWGWTGAQRGGPCPLRTSVPDGLNTVDWRLDPSAEPLTVESTAISLLVTERECVSGQSMGERLVGC